MMSQGEDGGYLSAEDVQSVQVFFVKCQDFCHFDANGARLRSIIEANLPWTLQFDTFHVASPAENVKTKPKLKSWKAAIVGAHPSLCADIAHAVDRALGGQSEHQYFGLSCPGHHSASHHCTFRCEVCRPEFQTHKTSHCKTVYTRKCYNWVLYVSTPDTLLSFLYY